MGICHSPEKHQYIAANTVSLGTFISGLINGWSSTAVPFLQSANTPLKSGGITVDELSWIASISNVGGCLGTLLFGYLVELFGRKIILCILPIPGFISFLMIVFGDTVNELYISRLLGGIACGGSYVVAPLYIMEISECKIRGYLTSKIQLFYNFGVFIAFVIGYLCSYKATAIIYCCVPVFYGFCSLGLRETPFYLMRHNKDDEAVKNFRYFRSIKEDAPLESEGYQLELNEIMKYKEVKEEKLNIKSDFVNKPAIKAQSLGILLALMNQLSGVTAMISYAVSVFKVSGSNYSPSLSALTIGFVCILGTITSTSLVENSGRKKLMISSSIGCSVVLYIFGISNVLPLFGYHVSNIIPVLCFGAHVFIASCGPLNLPYVIIPELLPHKIRTITLSFINSFIWILSFLSVKYFYVVGFTYGLYICLFFYASVLMFGAIILSILMPETKGKRFSEIQCCLCADLNYKCFLNL